MKKPYVKPQITVCHPDSCKYMEIISRLEAKEKAKESGIADSRRKQ